MGEYLLRWMTAGVLLATCAFSLQYEISSLVLVQLVMVFGLKEYNDIHQKILDRGK